MEIIEFTQKNLAIFLLVFTRISAIFVAAPIFSSRNIPARVRVFIAIVIALIIAPMVIQKQTLAIPGTLLMYLLCVVTEFIIGACISFVLTLFFTIIQVSGELMDTQVGFGIVNVVDPQSGLQMPLIGNFLQALFTLVFFITDLHHVFLMGLIDSFSILQINQAIIQPNMAMLIVELFVNMFKTAFQIAVPMLMVTLLVDISMGMLARTMPQMNVFVLGIPLKIAVGLFMLSVFLPTYLYILKVTYNGVSTNIEKILAAFLG